MERVGVYVLGMHRSGTSVATRLVNLLGVPLSIPVDWHPAAPDNPSGFWESHALIDMNNRLLALLGGDSALPPTLEPDWQRRPELNEIRSEALAVLESVYPSDQWVWKDPRTCITFPFWREIVPARPVVLFAHRNPLAVAQSLATRDLMLHEHSISLWERYTVYALRAAAGLPVYVLRYEDILENTLHSCEGLSDFLNAEGVALRPSREWWPEVAAFVDKTLDHTSRDVDVRAHRWGKEVAPLHEWLLSAAGAHRQFVPPDSLVESSQADSFFANPRSLRRRLGRLRMLGADWFRKLRRGFR